MPAPYSSYITAVQGTYAGLSAANFPGGELPPGPYLDEAPTMGGPNARDRISPPYVLLIDGGGDPKWTFGTANGQSPGQNAITHGSFTLEAYAFELGDADQIMAAILWNGQVPNNRAGLAFTTFQLISPEKGIAGYPIPERAIRKQAGFQYNNQLVHLVRQNFILKTAISGDGL